MSPSYGRGARGQPRSGPRLTGVPEDVRARFAPVAANYAKAAFHTSPERLREVLELAQPKPTDLALDVATGTGNTALALAPFVARVVGLDLTREMLAHASRLTRERSIANAEWVLGDASPTGCGAGPAAKRDNSGFPPCQHPTCSPVTISARPPKLTRLCR